MNKTPPYEQRGAKMLDMMLDTHNHWGVLRSYKGSKGPLQSDLTVLVTC